jgi:glycogen operon protein
VEVLVRSRGAATVVEVAGDLDRTLSNDTVQMLRALAQPGADLVVDLTRVGRVGAVGFRFLLGLKSRVRVVGGILTVAGASERVRDLAEATGFEALFRSTGGVVDDARHGGAPPPERPPRIDVYPTHFHDRFALRPGFPLPFGATPVARGVNFSIYSRHACACTLVLFDDDGARIGEIPFPPECRIGDVYAMIVFDLDLDAMSYAFRMDGPWAPAAGHRFDATKLLLDPMARAVSGRERWGVGADPRGSSGLRARLVPDDFEWEGDRPLALPIEDLVIYELHVRGMTQSPSAGVRFPGTFAGLREKIPHLRALGINCVELMPIFEFDECEVTRAHPETGERLVNYWGYSTVAFYAPKAGYAATGALAMQADEFKALVKEFHRHGIEVILDVVFNHTAEMDAEGPTLSFRGIDNRTYYILGPDGGYLNFSGCGNTFNCNHPVVRNFVVDCLRSWVAEFHVDGFRFDLASILGRDQTGTPLANPPLLEALAMDPVLAGTKLIAEAWDAGGLCQVGSFPAYGRFAEWNARFRDSVRRFLRGDPGQVADVAQRIAGSPDLYPERGPSASINFITCHDGFTLADLVTYDSKHNTANGENDRDGADENFSWNCGVEGPSDDPAIVALRRRQVRNALAILFVSHGVPMLLMGDEGGRTQQGNNNAYCHDGPLTWLDWDLLDANAGLVRYCGRLIAFRRAHPCLRSPRHPVIGEAPPCEGRVDLTWHGTRVASPDWGWQSRSLAFTVRGAHPGSSGGALNGTDAAVGGFPDAPAVRDVALVRVDNAAIPADAPPARAGAIVRVPNHAAAADAMVDDAVYVACNMYWEPLDFELPPPPAGTRWHAFADTAATPPNDAHAPGAEPPLGACDRIRVESRAVVILVAHADGNRRGDLG